MRALSIEDRTLLYASLESMSQHPASAILAENKITFSKTVAYRSSSVTLARVCSSKLSLAVCEYWSVPCHHEVWGGRGISKQKPGPKRSVLYIGNLSPETTEERLVNFIQARSTAVGVKPPNIINARMFEPREGRDRIGARLTVASSDAEVLQATNFWPRPIYARAWNFHIVRLDKPQPLPLESHSNSSKRESGADLVSA